MGKFKYPNTYTHQNGECIIHCFDCTGQSTGDIIIDESDFLNVSQYQWHIEKSRNNLKYAQTIIGKRPNKRTMRLHRLILSSLEQIDHINHNGLDNRRVNLRICTNAENNRNKQSNRNPKSGHTGIRYNEKTDSYYVRIMVDKKEISLGHYKTLDEAIAARTAGEIRYFGEFRFKDNNCNEQ